METLNFIRLQQCEKLYNYQQQSFDLYSGVNYEGEFYPVPIRERELIKEHNLQLSYKDYVSGFEKGYSLPLPAGDEQIFSLLSTNYAGLKYFVSDGLVTKGDAINFGRSVGMIFRAWEVVIQRIEDFIPFLEKINSQDTLKALTKNQHIVRMKLIHTYLKNEKYIDCAENDFLYWFGLKELPKPPAKINWLKADSILKNVIHQICDTSGEQYINRAFKFNKHYVTTNYKTDYVGSNLFKKIEGYLFHAVTKI